MTVEIDATLSNEGWVWNIRVEKPRVVITPGDVVACASKEDAIAAGNRAWAALIYAESVRAAAACRDEGSRYGRVDQFSERAGCFQCETRILATSPGKEGG